MNTPEFDRMQGQTQAMPAEPGGIWGRIQIVGETTQLLFDELERMEKVLDSFLKPKFDGVDKDPGDAAAMVERRSDVQIKIDDIIENHRRLAYMIHTLADRVDI